MLLLRAPQQQPPCFAGLAAGIPAPPTAFASASTPLVVAAVVAAGLSSACDVSLGVGVGRSTPQALVDRLALSAGRTARSFPIHK